MRSDLPTHVLQLSQLRNRRGTAVDLTPSAEERAAIARELDIPGVKKLTFSGSIEPQGRADWQLTGTLGATVVQECVATLEPVTTRIDESVTRTYAADFEFPDASETEMPEDDTIEPLPTAIDVAAVMIEALSLALPPFPRADGAQVGQVLAAEDGVTPMTDEDTKPFAGLGALRDKLARDEDT